MAWHRYLDFSPWDDVWRSKKLSRALTLLHLMIAAQHHPRRTLRNFGGCGLTRLRACPPKTWTASPLGCSHPANHADWKLANLRGVVTPENACLARRAPQDRTRNGLPGQFHGPPKFVRKALIAL